MNEIIIDITSGSSCISSVIADITQLMSTFIVLPIKEHVLTIIFDDICGCNYSTFRKHMTFSQNRQVTI